MINGIRIKPRMNANKRECDATTNQLIFIMQSNVNPFLPRIMHPFPKIRVHSRPFAVKQPLML